MKNLLLISLFLISGVVLAQNVNIYGEALTLANYAVVDNVPQEGIAWIAGAHARIEAEDDSDFAVTLGVNIGYTSLSNTYKEGFGSILFGFNPFEYFNIGILGQYTQQSKTIGLGPWADVNIPIKDNLYIFGRGQLILTTTNTLSNNPTVASLGVGVKKSF